MDYLVGRVVNGSGKGSEQGYDGHTSWKPNFLLPLFDAGYELAGHMVGSQSGHEPFVIPLYLVFKERGPNVERTDYCADDIFVSISFQLHPERLVHSKQSKLARTIIS